MDDYCCFGCAPDNENGLKMEFYEDGDDIVSIWDPADHFQGYNFILHGGIRASLIDELAAWVIFVKLRTSGYTTRLDVKYIQPAYTNRGALTLRGRVKEMKKNIATIEVETYRSGRENSHLRKPPNISRSRRRLPSRG